LGNLPLAGASTLRAVNRQRPLVLHVVTLAEVGGAQSYVRDLLPAVREEFDVVIAAHGEGPLRTAAAELGVPFVPLHHVRRAISVVHDPLGLAELVRLFRRLRPDIVHLNSSKAGVLGRLAAAIARVPIRVFTAHGWAFKASSGISANVYLWADRAVRPLTTTVVCVSETELRAGVAARVCVADQTVVIPNAVDVAPLPERRTEPGPELRVVSVGRLAQPKDFSTLLTAVAGLPQGTARVRILGDGPLRTPLEAQISELDLEGSVELVGEVGDVRPFLHESDVFVLSSLSEGMPLSVLEAMAAGLPVIASDVGGLREVVVEGETGFLVPPGDPGDLTTRLASLAADRAVLRRLGDAGHKRAQERFSLPHWRERHLELYRSLLTVRSGTKLDP
jgi:glycosyltransferase involved in cell wall biosynthesis